ncbi:MAG: flagellar hook-associated protein FlgK [Burkholderiaceae bacterium]|jgi:flagellar hook-associated protein 1 FlgK|nr:flagellar hook-associated protein FlgK [Burkholderiaceae bacterium]
MAGLLGIGQGALMAAYAQLQTTGHNIANANTPGYSRQEAVFATAGGTYTGAGFLGMGVDLVTVQRSYDRFLAGELASSTAASAADSTRAASLERLQRVLAGGDDGIGAAIDDLNAALADVVNRASDPTAREIVVQRADTLALRIRQADSQMAALGRDADDQIANATGRVNELLGQFAGLNGRIAAVQASGHAPNDLLDERDRVLLQLNEHMKVTALAQDDGAVNLFAAGGEALLVGARAATLVVGADPSNPSSQRISLQNGTATMPMSADSFGGGSIAGWMNFRDNDLALTRGALKQLAGDIAQTYNDRQKLGVDAAGAVGKDMFATGGFGVDFRSVLDAGSELAAAWPLTAQLGAENKGQLKISSFDLADATSATAVAISFDTAGTYRIDGLPGGTVTGGYVSGSAIAHDGWSLTLRGAPVVGDEIRIVPNASPGTDGRNARAMITGSAKLTDSFATIVGEVGARAQSAQASRTASAGLLSNARAAQAEVSAVSLDEEAARLMQYQQMYQAAAKVIQAAQAMFDSLLAATAR